MYCGSSAAAKSRNGLRRRSPGMLLRRELGDDLYRSRVGNSLLIEELVRGASHFESDREQHMRARHHGMTQLLRLKRSVVFDALKRRRRPGSLEVVEQNVMRLLVIEVSNELSLQHVEIGVAAPHCRGRIRVLNEGEQEVLERRIELMTLDGVAERALLGFCEQRRNGARRQIQQRIDPLQSRHGTECRQQLIPVADRQRQPRGDGVGHAARISGRLESEPMRIGHPDLAGRGVAFEPPDGSADEFRDIGDGAFVDISDFGLKRAIRHGPATYRDAADAPCMSKLRAIWKHVHADQFGAHADLVNVVDSRLINGVLTLDGQYELPLVLPGLLDGLHGLSRPMTSG
jgi:hypothetical protein